MHVEPSNSLFARGRLGWGMEGDGLESGMLREEGYQGVRRIDDLWVRSLASINLIFSISVEIGGRADRSPSLPCGGIISYGNEVAVI